MKMQSWNASLIAEVAIDSTIYLGSPSGGVKSLTWIVTSPKYNVESFSLRRRQKRARHLDGLYYGLALIAIVLE
ncbi:hypothetical protein CPAR01_12042 [Colletotrichum paranaense]|uniref:Uncharacterized protein n=2 Tax=Colletotrichum acutatum species complex TaxID=2707335 RepID=A0AAI9V412_9PEZI|nr:uncharacterized protein CPAR01_12042 [Colletotrichum paranaense]KAK1469840.1 hypothetical protein CMEL01_01607 [Colletotrichum melonis]KAK1529730.1 hypothetical protein CPAR01_12042 [Colletotrichum paranaense]